MKVVITFIVAFVIGFYVNALLMYSPPEFLLKASEKASGVGVPVPQKDDQQNGVFVEFDGKKFVPSSVRAQAGQRIAITNMSAETRMHLVSDTEKLNTVRPYGESERHYAVIMEPGNYSVHDAKIANAILSIEVYPLPVPSVAK